MLASTKGLNHFNTSIYRVSISEYEKKITKIVDFEDEKGVEVVIVSPPDGLIQGEIPIMPYSSCLFLDEKTFFDVHGLYLNKSKEVAKQKGLSILELDLAFKKEEDYINTLFDNPKFDPIHPNKLGKDICTEEFYKIIVKSLSWKYLNKDSNIFEIWRKNGL